MQIEIKEIQQNHIVELKNVLDSCELFPSEYLDDMIGDYFTNPETEDLWFTALQDAIPVAIAYCVPEKLTVGTYNLLAIGVHKSFQGQGFAKKLMAHIEAQLVLKGARIIIVETSSDEAQIAARNLYPTLGYQQEAVIRDFWNEGEDKIIFRKRL
ncbi:MAG: hypothetical protein RL264_2655 [Bacteroidota bacterium]|jgi:ribosomal protein S18 acetylase RimI-like enzyme